MNSEKEYYEQLGSLGCSDLKNEENFSAGDDQPQFSAGDDQPQFSAGDDQPQFSDGDDKAETAGS
jgi:hypothetical protein